MTNIAEALRAEIRRQLDDGEFSIRTCAAVERLAKAAKGMLAAAGGMPVAQEMLTHIVEEAYGSYPTSLLSGGGGGALAPSIGTESFGARAINELIALAPRFLDTMAKKKDQAPLVRLYDEDPVRLVQALKDAREAQLPAHVLAALEAKLVYRAPVEFEPLPADPSGLSMEEPSTDATLEA